MKNESAADTVFENNDLVTIWNKVRKKNKEVEKMRKIHKDKELNLAVEEKKDMLDFLIMEFKEISEKLETTDKKVQFCTQLYITLITAIVAAAIGAEAVFEIPNSNFCFGILFFVLYLMGQFVLFYMISGQRIHSDYLCRLNSIRYLILKKMNKSEKFIEAYGYTKCSVSKKSGMNDYMIYLSVALIGFFYALGAYIIWDLSQDCWVKSGVIYGAVFLVFINGKQLANRKKVMAENAEKYEKNKKILCKEIL